MSTFEVTFRIVRPIGSTPIVAELADVLRQAAGLPHDSPAWSSLRAKLCAGESIRVRLGAAQFCRFFLGRREAGTDAIHRLKWEDAVELLPTVEHMETEHFIGTCPTCGQACSCGGAS